jgi:hypothetical protein
LLVNSKQRSGSAHLSGCDHMSSNAVYHHVCITQLL